VFAVSNSRFLLARTLFRVDINRIEDGRVQARPNFLRLSVVTQPSVGWIAIMVPERRNTSHGPCQRHASPTGFLADITVQPRISLPTSNEPKGFLANIGAQSPLASRGH
jgi:hypothetical protein